MVGVCESGFGDIARSEMSYFGKCGGLLKILLLRERMLVRQGGRESRGLRPGEEPLRGWFRSTHGEKHGLVLVKTHRRGKGAYQGEYK
jgi:hypothetical protein